MVVIIGANPTENHPVAATYFKQAAKRGTRLVVMDPRGMALKRHAHWMLQFKPGSDVAMLNAIMHVIVTEELYDRQYVQAHTDGFERLKAHLADYPPEAMAPICGIPAETLREVARAFARAERAMVFWGMGVSQHVHGTDNARCLISLVMMCGHVGRPGTGLHPLRGQNNVQGASDAGLIPMVFPDYHSVGDTIYPHHPGSALGHRSSTRARASPWSRSSTRSTPAGSRPCTSWARTRPCRTRTRTTPARRWRKLEHLVVQDIFLTETAMYADVVLPASAWPEKTGTVTNTNRQVQMGRQALQPPGEARLDWWITQELARRLGLDWNYAGPAEVFAEMKRAMPSLDNITWDRLEAESAVTYPCPEPDHPGLAVVFEDGVFPTKDGRATLVPAAIVPPAEQPDPRLSLGADHRPHARALAHRGHDPARRQPRRARARGLRHGQLARPAPLGVAAGDRGPRRHPPRRASS